MIFPSFGDADKFRQIGLSCFKSLTEDTMPYYGCIDQIRPIGASLYFSIGHLLGLDSTNYAYFYLCLNIIWFLIIGLLLVYTSVECGMFKSKIPTIVSAISIVLVLIVSFAGHIPVLLSDLPAFGILSIGIMFFFKSYKKRKRFAFIIFGIFVGLSILVKQSTIIFGAVFFISYAVLEFGKRKGNKKEALNWLFKAGVYCLIGVSISSLQFLAIFLNYGDFWLYSRAGLEHHNVLINQYELIAYSLPINSAYLASVSNDINIFTAFLLRFHSGLSQLTIPVYIGGYANSNPPLKTLKIIDYFTITLFFGFVSSFVVVFIKKNKFKFLKLLVLASYLFSILTAMTSHTEVRYYAFPKLFLMIGLIYSIYFIFYNKRERDENTIQ
ncbi:hypothetical protein VCSRO120_3051 [Vibrio cholerae]|uniref:MptD family putative ECF transporter S component n=1 Tax=Vibrio cholerae TaxID=666 RepID=UPI0011D75EDD|nr:MptD family putative ECF transporter S component [Vibrio cholerae]EGR1835832.1 hypothetical protein [Vibrio cholerae]TXX80915.1 hypothetical protein FXE95_04605 [Vibrio cholerae]TXX84750.1 hypothetical protein FXE94_04350 [Vibrio cholerae]BCN17111.1 hypothetical protein [Vibrio cholerae]BCN17198.1 hypothetical protein [Vibrio cholerae]